MIEQRVKLRPTHHLLSIIVFYFLSFLFFLHLLLPTHLLHRIPDNSILNEVVVLVLSH